MNTELDALASRIRLELSEIKRTVDRVQAGWRASKRSSDDLYLDAVALNLHGFYGRFERSFELIAKVIDDSRPRSAEWHPELLVQMSTEIPGVRPSVISTASVARLDEYRKFRHLVRNVYTFKFEPSQMEHLVEQAPTLYDDVRAEPLAFTDFIDQRSRDSAEQ